jgi:magnesium-transporting ATPase (P-type)
MVHDICVSKTGCLTDADMVVAKYQICNNASTNDHVREVEYYDSFKTRLEVPKDIIDMIIESMIANTDVRIEIAERQVEDSDIYETEFVYEPCGQQLEVALIKFLYDSNEDVQQRFIRRNRKSPKLAQLPFDHILKRKTIVRQVESNPEYVRIYTKGAPEYIFELCNRTLDDSMTPGSFDQKEPILDEIIG